MALNPQDETIHFNLGFAFAQAGDLTNAEHEYKEALRLLPDYPEAHNNYGNLLIRLGRLAEAEEQLTEAVKQMPESAECSTTIWAFCGNGAKKPTRRCCASRRPSNATAIMWRPTSILAMAYLLRKDRERGIAELRETLRIKPGFEPAQRTGARYGAKASNPP